MKIMAISRKKVVRLFKNLHLAKVYAEFQVRIA
jgi:hypothetical protein